MLVYEHARWFMINFQIIFTGEVHKLLIFHRDFPLESKSFVSQEEQMKNTSSGQCLRTISSGRNGPESIALKMDPRDYAVRSFKLKTRSSEEQA